MELYKNKEWKKVIIGNDSVSIPVDCENKSLSNLILKIKDGTHDSFKDSIEKDAKYLLSAKNIKNNEIVFGNNERKISKQDYEKIVKNNFPQKEDLLFTIVGTIGESMIWEKDYPEAFQRSVSFIRVNKQINNKYLAYYLKSSLAVNEINKKTKVGAQPGIYLNDLKSLDILVYSFEEQNAIVSLLSSQELIIKKTKKLVENLEKRNQFMMDELLSGRLRVKEENGQPFFYKNPDDNWQSVKMNGEEVDIPKDWEKEHLGTSKIPFIKTGVKSYDGELEYYATGEVDDFQLGKKPTGLFTYKEKPSRANVKVLDNSIYLARMKNTLKIIKFEKSKNILLSTGFLGLLPNIQFVNLDFLYHVIKSDYFQTAKNKECKGATQETLSDGGAKKIEVILPKISEQQLIAKVLNILFEEKDKYQEILEKEEKTFTFLLEELMSGRLRVEV
jgi:type I restriction enzyme S subunit